MGGRQTFHWGAKFPDIMEAIAPLCSSGRTANFNKVFLLSLSRALTFRTGPRRRFLHPPSARRIEGVRRHLCWLGLLRTVLSHRGVSPQFGVTTCEKFADPFGEGAFIHHDANDLLALLRIWYDGNIADSAAVLGVMKARAVVCLANTAVTSRRSTASTRPARS